MPVTAKCCATEIPGRYLHRRTRSRWPTRSRHWRPTSSCGYGWATPPGRKSNAVLPGRKLGAQALRKDTQLRVRDEPPADYLEVTAYIQTVPLPSFRRSLWGLKAQHEHLGDPWRVGPDHRIEFFPRGSRAFVDAAKGVANDPERPVCFFPAYFCEGSLKPLREAGARIVFYRVTKTLVPEWEDVRRRAYAEQPDLFVLVHTFGHVQNASEAKTLADEIGCILLEDAAHVLRPDSTIGKGETLVILSPHKLVALPPISLLSVPTSLAERLNSPYHFAWRSQDWKWFTKRMVQKFLVALGGLGQRAKPRVVGFNGDEDGQPLVIDHPRTISELGVRLLLGAQRDLQKDFPPPQRALRRSRERLKGDAGGDNSTAFFRLDSGYCPLCLSRFRKPRKGVGYVELMEIGRPRSNLARFASRSSIAA